MRGIKMGAYVVLSSFREVMVPPLPWLLLLWGLQGLCAQDYEEDYEEEVATKKEKKLFKSNSIPQNGKRESDVLRFSRVTLTSICGLFPLMLLL